MEITTRLSDAGATEQALDGIEVRIGRPLPADYRRFMAEFNGGRPEPSGFIFATTDGPGDAAIRYFLTLDDRAGLYTVQKFLDRYEDRLPERLLPIACDSFGNLVLLDVGAKVAGNVFFWDHEREGMGEPTWDNVAFVAPSFTEFIAALE